MEIVVGILIKSVLFWSVALSLMYVIERLVARRGARLEKVRAKNAQILASLESAELKRAEKRVKNKHRLHAKVAKDDGKQVRNNWGNKWL